jgi:hypothetical protein
MLTAGCAGRSRARLRLHDGGRSRRTGAVRDSGSFQVSAAEVAELHVYMPDESEGEGFPPPRTIFQVVLTP